MGTAFGYAVATPTVIGILNSCKDKPPYAEWAPTFFSKEQGYALAQMVDVILPKTDTPSATEMNVHVFIDEYYKAVFTEEEQAFSKMVTEKFMAKLLESSGKESLLDVEGADFEPLFETYLAEIPDEVEEAHEEAIEAYFEALEKGETAELDEEIALRNFANGTRGMAIWSYKTSEYVGEEVLAYLPIPGEYIGCGDVNELSQGMAWSL